MDMHEYDLTTEAQELLEKAPAIKNDSGILTWVIDLNESSFSAEELSKKIQSMGFSLTPCSSVVSGLRMVRRA